MLEYIALAVERSFVYADRGCRARIYHSYRDRPTLSQSLREKCPSSELTTSEVPSSSEAHLNGL